MADKKHLARLPKVDQVLARPELQEAGLPKKLVKRAVRGSIEALRARLLKGDELTEAELALPRVALASLALAQDLARPRLVKLINATGVVVHNQIWAVPSWPGTRLSAWWRSTGPTAIWNMTWKPAAGAAAMTWSPGF